jgi:transcriptional regulator with XRE-family HTH domain
MPKKSDPFREAVGARLAQLRVAKGFDKQRHFAAEIDVPEATYTKWEKGKAMIPPYYVSELKRLFGVTADWVYYGDATALPQNLYAELKKAA